MAQNNTHFLLLVGLCISWALLPLAGLAQASAVGSVSHSPDLGWAFSRVRELTGCRLVCLSLARTPELSSMCSFVFNRLLGDYLHGSARVPRGSQSVRILEAKGLNWYTVPLAAFCRSKHFLKSGSRGVHGDASWRQAPRGHTARAAPLRSACRPGPRVWARVRTPEVLLNRALLGPPDFLQAAVWGPEMSSSKFPRRCRCHS